LENPITPNDRIAHRIQLQYELHPCFALTS
jgi:hypothetical protein